MPHKLFCPRIRALLGILLVALPACATPSASGTASVEPTVRTEPDDHDLWNLVPAEAQTLIAADMAQLRESPWTRGALSKATAEGRGAWKTARGFDELTDVDLLVFAGLRDLSASSSLLVAQGRLEREALMEAFQKQGSAQPSNYRNVAMLGQVAPTGSSDGGPALGFLTRRTVLSGSEVAVRAAIDCSFGVTLCLGTSAWSEALRRALAAGRGLSQRPPALQGVFRLDDKTRTQLQSEMGEGGALEAVGLRVDLSADLDISAIGQVHSPQQAQDMAARLSALIREQRNRPVVLLLGLRSVIGGIRIVARGSAVELALHVPEDQRESIAERMTTLAEMLTRAQAGRAAENSQ
jgi:hypothetical protein